MGLLGSALAISLAQVQGEKEALICGFAGILNDIWRPHNDQLIDNRVFNEDEVIKVYFSHRKRRQWGLTKIGKSSMIKTFLCTYQLTCPEFLLLVLEIKFVFASTATKHQKVNTATVLSLDTVFTSQIVPSSSGWREIRFSLKVRSFTYLLRKSSFLTLR